MSCFYIEGIRLYTFGYFGQEQAKNVIIAFLLTPHLLLVPTAKRPT